MSNLVIMGIYSILLIGTIQYYEKKMKDLRNAISDYKRALELSHKNMNNIHYTSLQLENSELRTQVRKVDEDNKALINLVENLKKEIAGDTRNIQYESSTYKNSLWESSHMEQNPPFVRKYGPTL